MVHLLISWLNIFDLLNVSPNLPKINQLSVALKQLYNTIITDVC